jgi:ATP synthase I chain
VFAHFELPNLPEVSRRTIASALVVGVAALVASFSFGHLLVGVGACIGLGMGTLNFRLIGVSVDKVAAMDVDNPKRPLAVNTLGRMGVITVIALGLTFLSKPLGFGVLGGLAAFQIILIVNVARSMAKAGPMTSVDEVIHANVIDDNEPVVSPAAIEAADDSRGGA